MTRKLPTWEEWSSDSVLKPCHVFEFTIHEVFGQRTCYGMSDQLLAEYMGWT